MNGGQATNTMSTIHYCRMLLTRHYDQRPFGETVCDAIIAKVCVKNPSKKVQNICDGGAIKHGSDFSCVCDAGQTVLSNELFAMRRNKRNGHPDEGVCDIEHTVHSDELFVIRQHKRNGQPDQCVCNIRHAVHSDELFALRQENSNGST